MPLLPSALPPKGEARRYAANDFLNLIALLRGGAPSRRQKSKLSTTIKAKNSYHFYKIKERIKNPWIKRYSINCSSKS